MFMVMTAFFLFFYLHFSDFVSVFLVVFLFQVGFHSTRIWIRVKAKTDACTIASNGSM